MSSSARTGTAAARLRPGGGGLLPADESAFVTRLVMYGFCIRVLVALVLEWTNLSLLLAPDEDTYVMTGWQLALYWSGELLIKPWRLATNEPHAYFYLNGISFYLFGKTELPLKLLNCGVGALSVWFVYLIARDLFGKEVAQRSGRLFAFLPSLVLWSALNIRDVWVVAIILYVSWKSLQVQKGYSFIGVVGLSVGVYSLTFFRDYLFFAVALPPIIALIVGKSGRLVRNFVLGVLASMVVLLAVQQSGFGQGATEHMSLEAVSKARQNLSTGSSAFSDDVDVSTPTQALAFLPTGLVYFLFSPFPWQITSFLKALSVPEMILIYYLTPAMFRGLTYILRNQLRECVQILSLTMLLTVSYALAEGNVGTLYRHRAQAIAFYLIFAAVGQELAFKSRGPVHGREGSPFPALKPVK